MFSYRFTLLYIVSFVACYATEPNSQKSEWDFCFSQNPAQDSSILISSNAAYSDKLGYGFETNTPLNFVTRQTSNSTIAHFVTAEKPFFFSARVAEGNYRVIVTLGDSEGESITTIKAEVRRLMLERTLTTKGQSLTREFIVNVRSYHISDKVDVKLKPRERTTELWNWDNKLTLEFNGPRPCIARLEIIKIDTLHTIYLAGDSTVCDQPLEPFASWGQMLPRFFKPTVAIANHAESGESLRSFIGEKRLAKLDTLLKEGDFLFIQMGHNDQKEKGLNVGAFTTYKKSLEQFIALARSHHTTPVLITPMNRRTFDSEGRVTNSLLDYPAAVRLVAKEQAVALIDLNAMSKILYENLGPEKTKLLFPTVRGQLEATHHNNYGSYELAKCIIQGIRDNHLSISDAILDNLPAFDPIHPDIYGTCALDQSPFVSSEKPYGN